MVEDIRREAEMKRRFSLDSFRSRLSDIPLDWQQTATALRDFGAFERPGTSLITHGGSSLTEVVVPFVQI